jgi:hypothetical protein
MPKKNALDEKLIRILAIVAAIILGAGVMLTLGFVNKIGDNSLSSFFTKIGDITRRVENKSIIQHRKSSRLQRLQWFNQYSSNIDSLRNPHTMFLGAHDNHCAESFESIVSLEDSLHTVFPLIQLYSAWGSKLEHQFPKLQVEAIINMGSIPVITWEPWLTEFNAKDYPKLKAKELRSTNGMTDVANGMYDSYIEQWALVAKEMKSPIYLRLGHEMNDPYRYPWGPQNNSPEEFVSAWRHIHDVFVKQGATNILWVWNPHLSYGYFDLYYPGSKYVDWIGADVLNFGTVASWSKWYSFEQIFGSHYNELLHFKKPIMLAEFSSITYGGDRKQWFADALKDFPQKYPAVKSILFFHVSDDKTTTEQALSWYFKYDTACTHVITKALHKWTNITK